VFSDLLLAIKEGRILKKITHLLRQFVGIFCLVPGFELKLKNLTEELYK
jgi:hypothetical protein